MVRTLVTSFLILIIATISEAQVLDYSEPVRLSSSINTDGEESMPLLSPDGNTLYFVRALSSSNTGGRYAGPDIWSSSKNDQEWKKADNKKFPFNTKKNNIVAGISVDGKKLYLLNSSPSNKINGIFFSKKLKDGWDKPELISIPGIDGLGCTGFYISPESDVIFISMKGTDTRGEEDLYITLKNRSGDWSIPRNLGPAINTAGFEISPFLSANKKRLYFASNGYAGKGDADIYYSDRLYDSWETWTTPRNLGSPVNSEKFDAYFSIYGDSVAYFSSNRNGGGLADIYRSTAKTGNESYAITQRYLTTKEIGEMLGATVSRKITFEKNVTEVSSSQKELLYYIATKLLRKTDINFHIVIQEESQPELNEARQASVYDQLRQAGIESYRLIIMTGKPKLTSTTGKGVIELNLFR